MPWEYAPSIGRFLNPARPLDTGVPQSWNAYGYADDTPVTGSDPTGACAGVDCPTRNYPSCLNRTPTNTKANAQRYKADVSNSTAHAQAEERALERQKATADAAAAAAKNQASGFTHRLLSLAADVIGFTDAYRTRSRWNAPWSTRRRRRALESVRPKTRQTA
ncbi:hypothetical protein ABT150_47390 [Streptomyces mirabilis]|uniref:hypothetical protein n=1 Tax=Streptomyces mirabilis TaxID=68239 RepID=UPI003331C7E4